VHTELQRFQALYLTWETPVAKDNSPDADNIQLTACSRVLRIRQSLSYSRISQRFREPQFQYRVHKSTGHYPETDESSPYHPILFFEDQDHVLE
jgi:hypothetical protein